MKVVNGRVELWLEKKQAGSGAPLLLLHDAGADVLAWGDEAHRWPGPVYALEFSGHGLSGRIRGGSYSAEIFAADADAVLAGLGPCCLAGVGLGAYVGLMLAGARAEQVPCAVLAPGAGAHGGGAEPDFRSAPRLDLPAAGGNSSNLLQSTRSVDPTALQCLARELRPSPYASAFARSATRLLFVNWSDGSAPPWWQFARETAGVDPDVPTLGHGIARMAALVGSGSSELPKQGQGE